MRIFSLYDGTTGLLVGRTFGTDVADPAAAVAANTPGHGAVEGLHDHLSRRVDLEKLAKDRQAHLAAHAATVETMRKNFQPMPLMAGMPGATFYEPPPPVFIATAAHVIDYQPPAPSPDHEWNPDTKRWKLSAAAAAKAQAIRDAHARIAALTRSRSPPRPEDGPGPGRAHPGGVGHPRRGDNPAGDDRGAWAIGSGGGQQSRLQLGLDDIIRWLRPSAAVQGKEQ